jgi:hypothetical protein
MNMTKKRISRLSAILLTKNFAMRSPPYQELKGRRRWETTAAACLLGIIKDSGSAEN